MWFLSCKLNDLTVMKHINAGVNIEKIGFLKKFKYSFFGLKMVKLILNLARLMLVYSQMVGTSLCHECFILFICIQYLPILHSVDTRWMDFN